MKNIEKIPARPGIQNHKKQIKKIKVAAYIRVSTLLESQNNSFEQQIEYYQKKIKSNPNWILAGIYSDKGMGGGTIKQRIGFQNMIADCMSGKIDMILTKSISRFARNTTDTLNTLRQLKQLEIGVKFERENIWTLDETGEFLISILASYAQEESRSISNNVKWGIRKGYAEGRYCFRTKYFLGYDKGGVINKDEAVIIRLIYRLALQKYSPYAIRDILNGKKYASPGGRKEWSDVTVKNILRNEKYMGDTLLQKEYVDDFITHHTKKNNGELPMYLIHNDHEAIVSKWVFDKVQQILQSTTKNTTRNHPLSEKIVCSCCGSYYRPMRWHSTTYNQRVWKCKGCKDNIHLYEKELYDTVLVVWRRLIEKYASEDVCGIVNNVTLSHDDLGFDELSIMLNKIIVYPDKYLSYRFIDRTSMKVQYRKTLYKRVKH